MTMVNFETHMALTRLYADYALAVDSGHWDLWPEFFTEQCVYKLIPRENHERGFPLCTLSFTSKGMLKDRVYGIQETLYHDPYYQRHIVGTPRLLSITADGQRIHAEANYTVIRTKFDGDSTILSVGYYHDDIVRTPEGLKFQSRLCVYDSEMIANSIIYPI
jgi:salicylate 5-hydroxylase small subunit